MDPEEKSEKDAPVRVVDRRWWARGEDSGADQPASSLKPTVVAELEQRVGELTGQLQISLADQRRASDEFEQVKSRLRRDTAREVERGKRAVFVELLEVVDNLDRAIAASASDSGAGNLVRGVSLVRDQFLAKLSAFGVQRVAVLGEPFDANRHEAVTTAPVDDPALDGQIISVVKEGYAIGDEVLRPASVVVGRAK